MKLAGLEFVALESNSKFPLKQEDLKHISMLF